VEQSAGRTRSRNISPTLRDFARRAFEEDLGRGDVTSELTVEEDALALGRFVAREALVVSGLAAAQAVFAEADPEVRFTALTEEGDLTSEGAVIAEVEGSARSVLAAERVSLNILMRLCGVATMTKRYVEAVGGTGASITDTRKTTPGMRVLEKAAVLAGGGKNHRAGLDDGVLIKDNHLALAGGVGEAVRRAKEGTPHLLKVQVEVEDMGMLRQALEAWADAVLLDNMSPEEVAKAVGFTREAGHDLVIEVSGGVDLGSVRAYAEAGPDRISSGALTHSAPAADISLDLEPC